MRSFSPWIAIVAAGAVQWLVGCSSDDNSSPCGDASPGEASTSDGAGGDATSQSTGASQDASSEQTPGLDATVADVGAGASADARSEASDTGASSREASVAASDGEAGASDAGAKISDAAATSDAAADGGPGTVTFTSTLAGIRIANWSPGAPAIDFCIAPHGTTAFQGPILANTAPALVDAGTCPPGPVGLAFTEVSSYSLVPPQQYDVRLVVAGATSCFPGIIDGTALPKLGSSTFETVAFIGETAAMGSAPGQKVTGFLDDWTPAPAGVAMRFIHAAPSLAALDLGTGTGSSFQTLFASVSFASTDTAAKGLDGGSASVDPNAYALIAPLSSVALSARTHGAVAVDGGAVPPAAVAPNVSAASGSVLTIVAIGAVADAGGPASLLECVDNAGTACTLANCTVISN